MAAITTTTTSFPYLALLSQYFPPKKSNPPINFFKPISASNTKPIVATLFSRHGISLAATVSPYRRNREVAVCCIINGSSDADNEYKQSNSSSGVRIDTKLPRRRLLVEFTCNECGDRTKRLINPLAYEKGLVFVQCGGCLRHHKLVDNLGLVVEYDFREEIDVDQD